MSEAEVAILDAGVRQWEDHGGPVLDAIIPAVDRILASRDARLAAVEALVDESWLITEAVAVLITEHAACTWRVTETEKGPEWSCGVVHQPTTRDQHIGALVTDHIAQRVLDALHSDPSEATA